MKKLIMILFNILVFVVVANSQHIKVATLIEKTVAGNQYGAQLVYQSKSKWSLGGFYQESILAQSDGAMSKNPFYGITLNAPIAKTDRLNFYFNTRVGFVNQVFLVVVPGLETELSVSKVVSLSAVMSMRMSYSSSMLKINIKI